MPFAFWLLFTPLLMCAQPSVPDRIIVKSDTGTIYYRMIECGSRVQPVDCHPLEQQRLNTRIKRLWIASAAKEYGIVLTPADETDISAQVIETHAFNIKAAAHFHELATLALRIRIGENKDSVYADAARSGITASEMDGELDLVRTRDVAEREAHKDFVADLERSTREYYTERARRREVTTIVQREASERHTSFAVAEERFWSNVIAKIHMRLIDETYQLPSRTGVLQHE
ncbi:MAG TPA: hypothetical protein VGQ65_04955 [Thermoanaerobaculia bacterium]|nr:hypothetical protein [Thermoanaerobaculia bacterium]